MQETRIPDQSVISVNNYTFHFSGNSSQSNKAREYGVGIAVHKDMMNCIKYVEPVNSRVMWMYLEDHLMNNKYIIFNVYGPTNVAEIQVKNRFWLDLEQIHKKAVALFPLAITLYGGDFNARVGAAISDTIMKCDVLGDKLLLDDKNENGEELLLFCQNNQLAIVNSFFSYPHNGVGTWPPNLFGHTLDHILIDKMELKQLILEAGVLDSIILPTDHRITTAMIIKKYSNNTNKATNNTKKRNNDQRDISLLNRDIHLAKRYRIHMEKELDIVNLIQQIKDNPINITSVIDKLIATTHKLNAFHIPKLKKEISLTGLRTNLT